MEYNDYREKYADTFPDLIKDSRYSEDQLEVLRLGSDANIDINIYSNPEIPACIMRDIYNYLKREHQYIVHYTQDNGLSVEVACYSTRTKLEALYSFYDDYDWRNTRVIDVVLRGGRG